MREGIIRFRIEERVDLDHAPVCLIVARSNKHKGYQKKDGKKKKRKEADEKEVLSWREEDIAEFKEKTSNIEGEIKNEDSAQYTWEEIKKVIKDSVKKKKIKIKKWKLGMRKW
ncbi:hypothetical protein TSAR_003601 [Trichomalopsis sarcophagae]|uniref:Uncharacterized protein n=1 Tax=Trichomalopsis sarcophagae TaxID=543379 RepID=A0A232EVY0_9HYME|nr:hypothetical protein TSAR_003601 [Trichomalopsis sarcophagae]